MFRVKDAAQLAASLHALLADPRACRERGSAARRALDAHRGSSERAAALIETVVAAAGGA